ncbi:MAG: aspartate/tyrosine/aromatic aminotransferase [bacterium]|nr:aspartate/tyrosine/aromatic aminotransferase [bacterium]
MFETLGPAPVDPILGITEAYNQDPNPDKINLSVGVYKDANGHTPIFRSVKKAESRVLAEADSKSYLGMDGDADYQKAVQVLLFGTNHEIVSAQRAATAQTPGGTGALRVAGDFIHQQFPQATVWLSDPTWANHAKVFASAEVPVKTYSYFDAEANGLDFEALLEALQQIPDGDVVLLHGCCHNPTGVDPTPEQWEQISAVVGQKGVLPLVDFAYQGLGDGLSEDGRGLMALCQPGCELLVASSFSKNFGLYQERIGALTVVAGSQDAARTAMGHVKMSIRTNYSNPPAHGSSIVKTILNDPDLRADWDAEVKEMRDRINSMRKLFVDGLERKGVRRDFSFVARQKGMFSYSGLTPEQVDALREKHSVYVVKNGGRINVAGMTEQNMDRLCEAIADVLK